MPHNRRHKLLWAPALALAQARSPKPWPGGAQRMPGGPGRSSFSAMRLAGGSAWPAGAGARIWA